MGYVHRQNRVKLEWEDAIPNGVNIMDFKKKVTLDELLSVEKVRHCKWNWFSHHTLDIGLLQELPWLLQQGGTRPQLWTAIHRGNEGKDLQGA